MALISRFARLFQADLHAVMDRLEEPAILLRQSIREMEASLDGDGRRRSLLDRERETLKARWERQDLRLNHIAQALEVCLDADKDDLARPLLRERLGIERARDLLEHRRAELNQRIATLDGALTRNAASLSELRDKAELLMEPGAGPDDGAPDWTRSATDAVSDAEVEIALLRARRQRGAS